MDIRRAEPEKGWTEPEGNGRIAVDIKPAEIKTKEGIFMSETKKTGHFRLTSQEHYSEAFCTSAFLALSGGFQDAYTYNCRDGVFSNAQTGNIVPRIIQIISKNPVIRSCFLFIVTSQNSACYYCRDSL